MDGRVEAVGPVRRAAAPAVGGGGVRPGAGRTGGAARGGHRAAQVEKYRERFWDHPCEPIGPEPTMAGPEKRAAWHAAAQALGRPADGPDLRYRDTGSLWLMRDTCEAETAWAPRFVGPGLRSVRRREITWAEETVQVKDYGQAPQITLFEHGPVVLPILTSDFDACPAEILAWLKSRWREETSSSTPARTTA